MRQIFEKICYFQLCALQNCGTQWLKQDLFDRGASILMIVCIYLYDVIYRFHFFYALCVSTQIVADMQDINEIVSTISTMMWHVFDVEYIFSSLYINVLIKKDNHLNIFRFYYHWSSSWWRVYYILTFSSLAHPPEQNL